MSKSLSLKMSKSLVDVKKPTSFVIAICTKNKTVATDTNPVVQYLTYTTCLFSVLE